VRVTASGRLIHAAAHVNAISQRCNVVAVRLVIPAVKRILVDRLPILHRAVYTCGSVAAGRK
jgi:hypothetical protein